MSTFRWRRNATPRDTSWTGCVASPRVPAARWLAARGHRGTGRACEARPIPEFRLDGRSLVAEGPTPGRTSRLPGLLERVVQLRRRKAAEAEAPADDPAA